MRTAFIEEGNSNGSVPLGATRPKTTSSRAAGGEAIPNYESVADPQGCANLVATAEEAFGPVDIVLAIERDILLHLDPENKWKGLLHTGFLRQVEDVS